MRKYLLLILIVLSSITLKAQGHDQLIGSWDGVGYDMAKKDSNSLLTKVIIKKMYKSELLTLTAFFGHLGKPFKNNFRTYNLTNVGDSFGVSKDDGTLFFSLKIVNSPLGERLILTNNQSGLDSKKTFTYILTKTNELDSYDDIMFKALADGNKEHENNPISYDKENFEQRDLRHFYKYIEWDKANLEYIEIAQLLLVRVPGVMIISFQMPRQEAVQWLKNASNLEFSDFSAQFSTLDNVTKGIIINKATIRNKNDNSKMSFPQTASGYGSVFSYINDFNRTSVIPKTISSSDSPSTLSINTTDVTAKVSTSTVAPTTETNSAPATVNAEPAPESISAKILISDLKAGAYTLRIDDPYIPQLHKLSITRVSTTAYKFDYAGNGGPCDITFSGTLSRMNKNTFIYRSPDKSNVFQVSTDGQRLNVKVVKSRDDECALIPFAGIYRYLGTVFNPANLKGGSTPEELGQILITALKTNNKKLWMSCAYPGQYISYTENRFDEFRSMLGESGVSDWNAVQFSRVTFHKEKTKNLKDKLLTFYRVEFHYKNKAFLGGMGDMTIMNYEGGNKYLIWFPGRGAGMVRIPKK